MILFLLALTVRIKKNYLEITHIEVSKQNHMNIIKKTLFLFFSSLFFFNSDNHLILLLAKNMVIDSLDVYNLRKKLDGREINFDHLTLL